MRAMLRSTLSMSMTAQGVPYSRAILAARGVVIGATPVLPSLRGAKRRSNPYFRLLGHGLLRFARNDEIIKPVLSLRAKLPAPASGLRRRRAPAAPWRSRWKLPRTSCDPWRRGLDRQAAAAAG